MPEQRDIEAPQVVDVSASVGASGQAVVTAGRVRGPVLAKRPRLFTAPVQNRIRVLRLEEVPERLVDVHGESSGSLQSSTGSSLPSPPGFSTSSGGTYGLNVPSPQLAPLPVLVITVMMSVLQSWDRLVL